MKAILSKLNDINSGVNNLTEAQADLATWLLNKLDEMDANQCAFAQKILDKLDTMDANQVKNAEALLDAVSACSFLSKSKKISLQNKLLKSFSIYDRENYLKGLYSTKGKANESMYKSIDFINKAINKKATIEFKYMKYMVGKGRVPRHNGKIYVVSPYALILNNQRYYLVGYSFKDNEIRSYRVDRMDKAIESETYKYKPLIGKIDKYVNESFGMYYGEEYRIVLKCKNEMLDQVIDKFGNKIETSKIDNEYFTALVVAQDSPTFYSWVFSFGGDIKIISPENIVNNFNELLNKFK